MTKHYAAEYHKGWFATTNDGPRGQKRDDCIPRVFPSKQERDAWVAADEKRVTVGTKSTPDGWGEHVFRKAAEAQT